MEASPQSQVLKALKLGFIAFPSTMLFETNSDENMNVMKEEIRREVLAGNMLKLVMLF